jgi:metal-responsive CopG/Arc/MetJ family transcriptional regulator
MTLWKLTRKINLALPEELLARVDAAAAEKYMSRSEYIRYVLNNEVLKQQSDSFNNNPPPDQKWLAVDDS